MLSISESDFDDVIAQIIESYPESEWMARCRLALPDSDDGYIMSVIEMLNGGDVKVID